MSYDVEFTVYGRTYIDWSRPDDVQLCGRHHGKVKLLKKSSLTGDDKTISIVLREVSGTHFAGLYTKANYHSPSITVYIVPKPEKGNKGWAYEVASWDVTREKKALT
jgi:hypothetical protein